MGYRRLWLLFLDAFVHTYTSLGVMITLCIIVGVVREMTFLVIPVGLKLKLRSLLYLWNEHEVNNEIVIMWLDIKYSGRKIIFYRYLQIRSTNNLP